MPRCPTCKRSLPSPRETGGAATPATPATAATPATSAAPHAPPRYAPFCSQRCKLADLHGWLNDRYVISEALPFDEIEGRLPTLPTLPTEDP